MKMSLSGSVLLYWLSDACWEFDLAGVEKKAAGARRLRIEKKRFSEAFEFSEPPVTLALGHVPVEISRESFSARFYAKVYEYGVLSILAEIPFADVTARRLEEISRFIRAHGLLKKEAGRQRERLLSDLKQAMKGPGAAGLEEEYSVYFVRKAEPWRRAREVLDEEDLVSLLLGEEGEPRPSAAVREELLSRSFSYTESDLVVLNWDNAFVIDPGGSMDIPDLLEFANAQLLGLRVYDKFLDTELENIYERVSRRSAKSIWKVRRYRELSAKVMKTITELTGITEKIDNSLKVTNDVYYAKVYSATLRLFRVRSWEKSLRHKLDIAFRTYSMLYHEISTRRSELLELTIIILIAVEIVFFVFIEWKH